MSATWPLSSWAVGLPSAEELQNATILYVADKTNRLIGEIHTDFNNVAWRLNAVSRVDFAISRNDAKATRDMLRFGNRILIQFINGLPNWPGVFDPPRHWTNTGEIKFQAYSAEAILGWRQTGRERIFDGATVGFVYQKLIEEANALRHMGIEVGDVWTGGAALPFEFHYANILETIEQELVENEMSTYDFDVTGEIVNGRIVMKANFYERKGRDLSGKVVLHEGHNIHDVEVIEQGPIQNAWDTAGRGSGWDDERAVGYADDTESIAEFDFRQGFAESETSEQVAVDELARNRLAQYRQPVARALVSAVNLAPALFSSYGVGDTVQLTLPSYGWDGYDEPARIITREYFMNEGYCKLVPEVEGEV
ncbi:MAG: hypothetical protein JXA14_22975 [Anaerolineae bacterium]|nr:hypothetical protein [Anaerolineae bacterium]